MSTRILIAGFEIPTEGGSATNGYTLFAKMKRDGLDACYLNLVERTLLPYYEWSGGRRFGNPERLTDVHNCVVDTPLFRAHPTLTETIARIAPTIVLARGYIAALLIKLAAPPLPVVLFTAGSRQTEFLIEHGRIAHAVDLDAAVPRSVRLPATAPGREGTAFDAVDLIVAGSELSRDAIRRLFHPDRAYKVHEAPLWSAEWVVEGIAAAGAHPKPFGTRTIDVLFCATNWARGEKNLPAVRRITQMLPDLRVVVAGRCDEPVAGARLVGRIIDRSEMFRLMGEAKVVASASLVDACPGTLFEAAALGCNVVATKNCGNWQLCHEDLLVDPPSEAGIAAAIRRGVERSRESNLEWFLRTRSYERLVEILHALATDGARRSL
jgi:glycosyltransferase involved in cell wall biosynthesis